MPTLSKSRFVSGNQCAKKLYFDINHKELKPATSEQKQAIFDSGHRVGILAQQVFPNGKDASLDMNNDWSLVIDRTQQWISERVTTIY